MTYYDVKNVADMRMLGNKLLTLGLPILADALINLGYGPRNDESVELMAARIVANLSVPDQFTQSCIEEIETIFDCVRVNSVTMQLITIFKESIEQTAEVFETDQQRGIFYDILSDIGLHVDSLDSYVNNK